MKVKWRALPGAIRAKSSNAQFEFVKNQKRDYDKMIFHWNGKDVSATKENKN